MNKRLSHSQSKAYMDCSLQHRFRYYYKLGTRSDKQFFLYGTALHEVYELIHKRYIDDSYKTSLEEAEKMVAEIIENIYLDSDIDIDMSMIDADIEMGKAHVKCYYEEVLTDSAYETVIDTEKEFEVPLIDLNTGDLIVEGYTAYGFIDKIRFEDGYIIVTDYKTAKTTYSDEKIRTDKQLTLYSYVARYLLKSGELEGVDPSDVKGFKEEFVVFLKHKVPKIKVHIRETTELQIKQMLSAFKNTAKGIQAEIYVPNRESRSCFYCDFKNYCDNWYEGEYPDEWLDEYMKKIEETVVI